MRVLITGGTGLIGRALSAALVTDGHEVTALSRDPIEARSMPDGVLLYRWDAESADGWGQLADGAEAIINLAGAGIGDKRWSTKRKQEIRNSRIRAGQAVMAALNAAQSKPRTLIQASAVGYYGGQENDMEITEASPNGDDFLAGVCHDWEMSTAPAVGLGIRRPVIRTGVVFSTEGGAFPRLKTPFTFFVGGPLGNGEQWLPWIHIEDSVRAIQFLLADENADGPYNLCGPNPVRNKELADDMAEVMGRTSFLRAPGIAIRPVLGEMASMVLEGQRAVPARLLDQGFAFKHPELNAAIRDLLGME